MLIDLLPGILVLSVLTLFSVRPDLWKRGIGHTDGPASGTQDIESASDRPHGGLAENPAEAQGDPWTQLSWEQRLIELEEESSRSQRRVAFKALVNLNDPRQDSAMVDLLRSNDAHLSVLALRFALRKNLSVRRFPLTKKEAPTALRHILTKLATGWGRADDVVAAMNIAQRQKNIDLEPLVLNCGQRDSTQIRAELVDYLKELGTHKALPLLREIADRKDERSETRGGARVAIERIKERSDLPVGGLSITAVADLSGALGTTEE